SERGLRRQRERPLRAAPLPQRQGPAVALVALAVLQGQLDLRPRAQQHDTAGRVAAQDRLEMDLFPEAVDAAVAEHGPAQERPGLGQVEARTERPGLDALVPVAADVGRVAVL